MVDERKGALSFRNIHKEFIDNDGNKFLPGSWFCFEGDDIYDAENWSYLGDY